MSNLLEFFDCFDVESLLVDEVKVKVVQLVTFDFFGLFLLLQLPPPRVTSRVDETHK